MATRDRLTGEPLRRETPKLVSRTHYPGRSDAPPLRLHVLQPETAPSHAGRLGKFAGGMKWSPAFGEYIGHEVSPLESQLASNYHWQEWWKSTYLTRYLAQRMGLDTVRMLFALRMNGRDYATTAALYGKTPGWLARKEGLAWALARQLVTAGANN